MTVSPGWKVAVIVVGVATVVSTPLVWLMNGADGGQLTGASVQVAVGIAALVVAVFQRPQRQSQYRASGTGEAQAEGGGTAHTGIRASGRSSRGVVSVRRTGKATARGRNSSAGTGIDHG